MREVKGLLKEPSFREVIKLLLRNDRRFRACWLAMRVGGLSVADSREYVESCEEKSLVRVVVGLDKGQYCGYSSSEEVSVSVVEHSIGRKRYTNLDALARYQELCREMWGLDWDENGKKEGRQ